MISEDKGSLREKIITLFFEIGRVLVGPIVWLATEFGALFDSDKNS